MTHLVLAAPGRPTATRARGLARRLARHPLVREVLAAARLDLHEVLRSRWLILCAVAYAALAGGLVLVGMRESSLLGFTGMGRVILSLCHALLLLLPLLALAATGQVVNRARDDGTLELLFSLPLRRSAWFVGTSLVRLAALAAPLFLLLLGMGAVGQLLLHQAVPWPFVWRALLTCVALIVAFTGLGLAISTFVRHPARAMMYLVVAWGLGVALLDFGLIGAMLRWHVNPRLVFLLAGLNPVESARLALLSGLDPELATLGPVGFYLATRLGGGALYALGVLWPLAAGAAAWGAALWRFRRGDLV
jgi:ABC-type transport system involved in multi-copper enzyme maturation permease subunit